MLFKPYTHLAIVDEARADLIDDGKITIEQQSYTVPSDVVSAVRDFPEYFNAGAVGPDGFPDLVMGQSIIHPKDSGLWLQHVLSSARNWTGADKPQVLAWAYGYLAHGIGDMWAHTLTNEFTGGPFPDVQNVVTNAAAKSNALKHVLIEGYIADATPGYDANPDRTLLPDGDVSNDSTREITFAAPSRFIYETFVKEGSGPVGNTANKGQIIDSFIGLRDKVRQMAGPRPTQNPEAFANAFANTKTAYDTVQAKIAAREYDFALLGALKDLGIAALSDSWAALSSAAQNIYSRGLKTIYSMYLHSWADSIDEGLQHYGEFGMAMTNGLFNPQSKRDAQNNGQFGSEYSQSRIDAENAVSTTSAIMYELNRDDGSSAHDGKSFMENHLLPMLGVPKFLTTIIDKVGDITTALSNAYGRAFQAALDQIKSRYPELVNLLNPIIATQAQIQTQVKEIILDFQSAAVGVDVREVQSLLANPSAHLDDTQVTTRYGNIPLFLPEDHAKLDSYLGITNPSHHTGPGGVLGDDVTFSRQAFAAFGNAVTMTKLLFLDGQTLDTVLSDLSGAPYELYGPANGNIMTTPLPGVQDAVSDQQWLLSIDGDHAWRSDRQPAPGDGEPGAGAGNFPLWEDSRLRDTVFRRLFKDWQNGPQNFPDLGDLPTIFGGGEGVEPPVQVVPNQLMVNLSDSDDDLTIAPTTLANGQAVYGITWGQATGVVTTTYYQRNGITSIVVNALGGVDTLRIAQVIGVPVEFAAGAGVDRLVVNDGMTSLTTRPTLGNTSLTFTGVLPEGITWDSNLESLGLTLGSGNDELTIQGDLSGRTVSIDGNDGDDRFIFAAAARLAGTLDGGKGLDVIQASSSASSQIAVLGLGTVDGFQLGGLDVVSGAVSNVDGVAMLGAGLDRLTGLNTTSRWQVTGTNAGSYTDETSSRLLAFSGVENLLGGTATDRFILGSAATMAGTIDGDSGSDAVEFADEALGAIMLTGLGAIDGFDGRTGTSAPSVGAFKNMNVAVGGGNVAAGGAANPADRFDGLNSDAVWNLQAGRMVDVYSTQGRSLSISRFEILNGGTKNDKFTIDYSPGLQSIASTIVVAGGGGANSVSVIGSSADDIVAFVGPFMTFNGRVVRMSRIGVLHVNTGYGNDQVFAAGALTIGMKSFGINLGAGNDKATVTPSLGVAIAVNGGLGTDSLTVISGLPVSQPAKRSRAGSFSFGFGTTVGFVGMESWRKL